MCHQVTGYQSRCLMMRSDEADTLGQGGIINLEETDALTFLQLIYGMLEGLQSEGVGTEVQFEDIDGVIKSMWMERWTDV